MTNRERAKIRPGLAKFASLMLAGLVFFLAGCGGGDEPVARAREFTVRGSIRGISPDQRTLDVEHEAIPNYMPAMTMPFSMKDPAAAKELKIGDTVSFRMLVTDQEAVIDRIQKIDPSQLRLPSPSPTSRPAAPASARLRPGDMMPPFQLVNEEGAPMNAETFHGRPFVLTFIFTRCPIPTFCPRMAQNFSALQKAVQAGQGALAETRLLSITIDPQFDTPTVLKEYGRQEGADPKVWNFATGDPAVIDDLTKRFAVYRQNEGGTISHGLTTALIDREGKVAQIWRGNGWKTEEVLREIDAPKE